MKNQDEEEQLSQKNWTDYISNSASLKIRYVGILEFFAREAVIAAEIEFPTKQTLDILETIVDHTTSLFGITPSYLLHIVKRAEKSPAMINSFSSSVLKSLEFDLRKVIQRKEQKEYSLYESLEPEDESDEGDVSTFTPPDWRTNGTRVIIRLTKEFVQILGDRNNSYLKRLDREHGVVVAERKDPWDMTIQVKLDNNFNPAFGSVYTIPYNQVIPEKSLHENSSNEEETEEGSGDVSSFIEPPDYLTVYVDMPIEYFSQVGGGWSLAPYNRRRYPVRRNAINANWVTIEPKGVGPLLVPRKFCTIEKPHTILGDPIKESIEEEDEITVEGDVSKFERPGRQVYTIRYIGAYNGTKGPVPWIREAKFVASSQKELYLRAAAILDTSSPYNLTLEDIKETETYYKIWLKAKGRDGDTIENLKDFFRKSQNLVLFLKDESGNMIYADHDVLVDEGLLEGLKESTALLKEALFSSTEEDEIETGRGDVSKFQKPESRKEYTLVYVASRALTTGIYLNEVTFVALNDIDACIKAAAISGYADPEGVDTNDIRDEKESYENFLIQYKKTKSIKSAQDYIEDSSNYTHAVIISLIDEYGEAIFEAMPNRIKYLPQLEEAMVFKKTKLQI